MDSKKALRNSSALKSTAQWHETEALVWGKGTGFAEPTAEEQVLLARVRENDFRKAEALCSTKEVGPLQTLRTFLSRGMHADTARLLTDLMDSAEHRNSSELWLEKSRLEAYSGLWTECVKSTVQALDLEPSGLTQLTLLQVRSIALFELGHLEAALLEIDKMESIARLYPLSTAPFFGSLLKFRIFHRTGRQKPAEQALKAIWDSEFYKRTLNLDRLLALLRTEIAFRRNYDIGIGNWMRASLAVAEGLGDSLYAALARLDLASTGSFSVQNLNEQMQRDRNLHPRIHHLLRELTDKTGTKSASAQGLGG